MVDIPPAVTITSQAANTDFTVPATIAITATASDDDTDGSVTNLAFFADGTRIGQLTNPPYTFLWSGALPGIYDLTAQATDNRGLSTLSSPVTIFVITTGGVLTGCVAAVQSGSVVDLTSAGT